MYLRIKNGEIEFLHEDIHIIEDSDIKILQEEYDKFFELQSDGMQFQLKKLINIKEQNNVSLFDLIEEYEQKIIQSEETEEQKAIEELKKENETLKSELELIKEKLGIN